MSAECVFRMVKPIWIFEKEGNPRNQIMPVRQIGQKKEEI